MEPSHTLQTLLSTCSIDKSQNDKRSPTKKLSPHHHRYNHHHQRPDMQQPNTNMQTVITTPGRQSEQQNERRRFEERRTGRCRLKKKSDHPPTGEHSSVLGCSGDEASAIPWLEVQHDTRCCPRGREVPGRKTVASSLGWLSVVLILLLSFSVGPSSAQHHQAKVDSPHCSYTLVVNEFDMSKCPAMQADAQPGVQGYYNQLPPHYDKQQQQQDSLASEDLSPGRGAGGRPELRGRWPGAGGGSPEKEREVVVLKSQVRELEERLVQEMVVSRQLNRTLGQHSTALGMAERQLQTHQTNFTQLYRALVFVQRQLKRQRKVNKSLNQKLSNVLLDVVEVNNVLTRGPPASAAGEGHAKVSAKSFQVTSVSNVRSCPGVTEQSPTYADCAAVYDAGHQQSAVYYIRPRTAACPVPVWCDMETMPGGWLVFQRRQDGSVSFNRDWATYREGFGSVVGEHWLGNDNLFLLTNQDHYQLRVDLWDFSGNRVYAVYSTFRVAGERDKFQLIVKGHSGSAQDSLHRHNGMRFSTPDRDNDGRRESHCGAEWEAGWWFNDCWFALLNGAYHNRSNVQYRGIAWNHWKREQLRKSEMKIRPAPKLGNSKP